jgi:Tfp pilus assembly protein PilF
MDGRTSALALFALAFGLCGCVTTHEKKVSVQDQLDPPTVTAGPHKEEAKKPPPPRVLHAFAQMKEKEADGIKDNPDAQAARRDEARRSYQEILKADPDSSEAFRGLARIYVCMGDYERATQTYRKALAKRPRDVEIWHDFGMMHDRRKEWAEGAKCFKKALEIDPEHQKSLKALGFTLARVGQLEQSVVFLTRAMGSSAAAHYNVALMLTHVAKGDEAAQKTRLDELARQHLRLALQQDPNYERARDMLATLEPAPGRGLVQIQFAPSH